MSPTYYEILNIIAKHLKHMGRHALKLTGEFNEGKEI
jgi:hypothetical protein